MNHTIHGFLRWRNRGLRILCGFFEKSFSLPDVLKIDSFEEHGELGAGERDACVAGRRQCEMKGSFFDTFIPDGESVVVPVKDFDFVPTFIEEDEVGGREWIVVQYASNNAEQPVERFTNIDGLAVQEYGDVRRRRQHAAMAARSSSSEWEANRTM